MGAPEDIYSMREFCILVAIVTGAVLLSMTLAFLGVDYYNHEPAWSYLHRVLTGIGVW